MTPELWQRLKPLYDAALDIPKENRAQFIAKQCGDDDELRRELEALLAANDEGTDSLEAPLVNFRNLDGAKEDILPEGTLLLGRFKIVRRVGSGGMGDVYEAIDLELGRIALKTIRPAIAQNSSILARFKEEVLLARPISGPNVCHIYELYVPPKGSGCPCAAFLTMEFLDGVTLADRIANSGPVPPKEALKVAAQLCAALQSIHDAGVVHRDLKPRNVMLVPRNGSEQVVVMDFGLAHALSTKPSTDATGLTIPGVIMGTPAYMAPEQFEGREVSPATDIYALGIVLYESVTGRQPFAAPTPFGAAIRRGRQPDSASSIRKGVPPVWDDVITRCIEYEPARRYQSADEVLAVLNQHAFVVRFPRGLRIALSRRTMLAAASVALLVLAVGGWRLYEASRIQTLSPEGQSWYNRGMMALRDGTYLQAIKDFQEVVLQDKKYALTHARLADAWAELDFTGQAQSEMLQAAAPEAQSTMPELAREYVDAVRKTLIRDYSAAAQDYEEILHKLPDGQKADGYVDLGRAQEKAGRIKETIASYERAAKMRPDDPAPFVHLGILKSRQRDPAGAEAAFSKAEALYQAESNLEGLAEVAYQRGYAANEAADSEHAHEYLNRSLAIARQINSPQLEARTLSQLSSVEYNDSKDDEAIADANLAIQIARENDLEYWSTDGLIRLGNAYLDKQDTKNAELYLEQALRLAQQNQHPRLQASSSLSLASLRDQQGRRDEQISLARNALKYYRDFGFMNAAADASALVVRGEEGKGEFSEALRSATEMLDNATRTNSQPSIERAEELVGNVSLDLEEYPSALAHYEKALEVSRALHQDEAYQALHCADTLWRLGRYHDADEMLASMPAAERTRADIASGIENTRAHFQLSQTRYRDALNTSSKAIQDFPDAPTGKIADFVGVEALAEGQIGEIVQAKRDADQFQALAHKEADESMAAVADLIEADVSLHSHLPDKARPLAEQANQYFSNKGKRESEWLSLFYLAKAAKASGDAATCANKAAQAIDILNYLEHSWGSQVFYQYASRPDYQLATQQLSLMRNERTPQSHERAKGY